MKFDSCNIPFELRKSADDPQISEIVSLLEPPTSLVLFNKNANDDVVSNLFETPMEAAAARASREAEAGASILRLISPRLTGETGITVAAQLGIQIRALSTNWDLWATATEKINGVWVSQTFRIGRISPKDIGSLLLRRTFTREQSEVVLDQALDVAGSSGFAVSTKKAKDALGHGITTDKYGMAMDFNPSPDRLREAAYRDLRETLEDDLIDERMVDDHMMILERNMNSHLFGESADTGATIIRMTGARSKDEIAAVRALAQEAEFGGAGSWAGITTQSTDKEIAGIIKKLKDDGFVFHHSGKVSLDVQNYPMVEMQLIKNEAHSRMLTSYEGISLSDIIIWQNALGQPSRARTVVEQLLQHVGGCKGYSVFYGTGSYN